MGIAVCRSDIFFYYFFLFAFIFHSHYEYFCYYYYYRVGCRSIEACKCYYGSLLTPSFRRSTALSGGTIKYLRYDFKRRGCHYKLA